MIARIPLVKGLSRGSFAGVGDGIAGSFYKMDRLVTKRADLALERSGDFEKKISDILQNASLVVIGNE